MIDIPYKTTWQLAIIGGLCGTCNMISWTSFAPALEFNFRLVNSIIPGLLLGIVLFLYLAYRKINERFYAPYHILFIFITVISYTTAFNFALNTMDLFGSEIIVLILSGIIGGFIFACGFKMIEPELSWIKGVILPSLLGGVVAFLTIDKDSPPYILWITWQAVICGYFGFLIDRLLKKNNRPHLS